MYIALLLSTVYRFWCECPKTLQGQLLSLEMTDRYIVQAGKTAFHQPRHSPQVPATVTDYPQGMDTETLHYACVLAPQIATLQTTAGDSLSSTQEKRQPK